MIHGKGSVSKLSSPRFVVFPKRSGGAENLRSQSIYPGWHHLAVVLISDHFEHGTRCEVYPQQQGVWIKSFLSDIHVPDQWRSEVTESVWWVVFGWKAGLYVTVSTQAEAIPAPLCKWGRCPRHGAPLFVHRYRSGRRANGVYLWLVGEFAERRSIACVSDVVVTIVHLRSHGRENRFFCRMLRICSLWKERLPGNQRACWFDKPVPAELQHLLPESMKD